MRLLARYVLEGRPPGSVVSTWALAVKADLTDLERASVVELILSTFPPDQAEGFCQAWFADSGYPSPAFTESAVADARFWADGASASELDAYAMACVRRMSAKRRGEFLKWAGSLE